MARPVRLTAQTFAVALVVEPAGPAHLARRARRHSRRLERPQRRQASDSAAVRSESSRRPRPYRPRQGPRQEAGRARLLGVLVRTLHPGVQARSSRRSSNTATESRSSASTRRTSREDARRWQQQHGITYPSVHDGGGDVLDEVGRPADPEDLLRRNRRREGRGRDDRRGGPAAVPAADRELVKSNRVRARRRAPRGARSACKRAAPDGVRARRRSDVSGVRDDARPVELARGRADQASHRTAHRRGRHEGRDQGKARRELRRLDPRSAASARLRPVGMVVADRWNRRRRGRRRHRRLALDPGAEPATQPVQLDPALERRLDDELRRFEG